MHGYIVASLAGKLLFHALDDMMRHKWFAIVLANVPVRVEAGFGAKVTGELAAIVVFHNNDFLAARKDAADLGGVDRDDPLDVKLIRHDAFFSREFLDGLANHALC